MKFGKRFYDPEAGRWITKDPLQFGGLDSNLYSYSLSDPVNYFDPLGLSWIEFDRAGGFIDVWPGEFDTYGPPQRFPAKNNAQNPDADPFKTDGYGPIPSGLFETGNYADKSHDRERFGSGIFYVNIKERPGIGIHAGRDDPKYPAWKRGVNHQTQGCIRTTEGAMEALRQDVPAYLWTAPK